MGDPVFDDGCDELLNRRRADVNFEDRPYDTPGTPVMVGKVYDGGSIPTMLPGYFLTHPVRPTGTESEGSASGYAVDTSRSVVVLVVGTVVPSVGDYLICRNVGLRWVAEMNGNAAGGVVVPGCEDLCTHIPETLHQTMTGTDFTGLIQPCTYTWQVNPYGGVLMGFYSEELTDGVNLFRYHFLCGSGSYIFRKIFPAGGAGGGIWRWVPGGSNTCSPFKMISGTSLAGGGYTVYNPKVQA